VIPDPLGSTKILHARFTAKIRARIRFDGSAVGNGGLRPLLDDGLQGMLIRSNLMRCDASGL
jgi:hypothetical protein